MITTTIIVAEDRAIVRRSLRSLLARETDLKAIDDSENGREAVTQYPTGVGEGADTLRHGSM